MIESTDLRLLGKISVGEKWFAVAFPVRGKLYVGCGPGTFAEMIPDRDLTRLDPIPAMLLVAEKRVNSHGNTGGIC